VRGVVEIKTVLVEYDAIGRGVGLSPEPGREALWQVLDSGHENKDEWEEKRGE